MDIIKIILLIMFSYLIGAIPFSFILCKKLKNIDIRTVGSKNVGATNAARILGKKWFFIIMLMDALKGFLIVFFTQYLINYHFIKPFSFLPILVSISVIMGHTFPIFLGFKGGKGVAVSAGVLLALDYRLLLLSLLIFILAVLISRYISLGSTLGSLFLPVSVLIFYHNNMNYYLFLFCLIISLYVIVKHKENIKRILKRTERKWGEKI